MRPLLRMLLSAGVCAVLHSAALSFQAHGNWKTFTPSGGGFTVKFPGVPSKSTQSADQPLGGHIAMTIYVVAAKPNIFMVEDAVLDKGSPALGDSEALLSGVGRGMAGSTNSKVISATKTTIQGFPAHRMVLAGQMTTKGITLLAGNHCYTVVIATKSAAIDQATLDKFVNSFKVQKHGTR